MLVKWYQRICKMRKIFFEEHQNIFNETVHYQIIKFDSYHFSKGQE